MANLSKVIKISKADYDTLLGGGTITKGGQTYSYDANAMYLITPSAVGSASQPVYINSNGEFVAGNSIPTATSDLTNDSGYIDSSDAFDIVQDNAWRNDGEEQYINQYDLKSYDLYDDGNEETVKCGLMIYENENYPDDYNFLTCRYNYADEELEIKIGDYGLSQCFGSNYGITLDGFTSIQHGASINEWLYGYGGQTFNGSFSATYNSTNKITLNSNGFKFNNYVILNENNWTSYILTNSTYNSSTNKIATMSDIPSLYEEITQSSLRNKIQQSKLEVGKYYRITDYSCFVVSSLSYMCQSAGHQFDIIVKAITTSQLDCNANACLHSGDTYFSRAKFDMWQLKVGFNESTYKYNWCDTTHICIFWMRDEYGNEAPYDFKNIQFKRYKNASTSYNGLQNKYIGILDSSNNVLAPYIATSGSTYYINISTTDFIWAYAYSFLNGTTVEDATLYFKQYSRKQTCDNRIGTFFDKSYVSSATNHYELPNIVFITTSSYHPICNNHLGNNCQNSTYYIDGTKECGLVVGDNNRAITFVGSGNGGVMTTIGNDNYSINLERYSTYGDFTIGNNNYQIDIRGGSITIGNGCYNIDLSPFGQYHSNITFGNQCDNIKINNGNASFIVFEPYCSHITLLGTNGTLTQYVVFTSSCHFASTSQYSGWAGRSYWTYVRASTSVYYPSNFS